MSSPNRLLRSLRSLAMTSVITFFLSGCATFMKTLPAGAKIETGKTSKGLEYSLLHYSQNHPDERFPLVIALHGKGGDGESYMDLWKANAIYRRVMVLTPTWDNWDLKGSDKKAGAFLGDLADGLDEITARYPVDSRRVTLAGLSAGGLVARWLLQVLPSKWHSVVFIAYASSEPWTVKPGDPFPPVLFVHGTGDEQFSSALVKKNCEELHKAGVTAVMTDQRDSGHEQKEEWAGLILQWIEKPTLELDKSSGPSS